MKGERQRGKEGEGGCVMKGVRVIAKFSHVLEYNLHVYVYTQPAFTTTQGKFYHY